MKNKIVLCIVGLTVASVFYYRYKKSKEQKTEETSLENSSTEKNNQQQPQPIIENNVAQEQFNYIEALPYYESESGMDVQHYKDDNYRLIKRSMVRSIVEDLYDAWEETSDNANFDKSDFIYALCENHGYTDAEIDLLLEDCNII